MTAPLQRKEEGRLPVTVIGGYLGAGKTTLLNRLLADPQGMRLAVIVNDFGSINIDASLIARREGETVSLTNGCVCCTIGDNLALALHDFAARSAGPQHIVVEASGVADPAKIAGYTASHPRLVLGGIAVVADAETLRARADDRYVGDLVRRQLAAADLILLSKTDLITAEAARRVQDWIARETPGARIASAPAAGCVADLLLTGSGGRSASSHLSDADGHDRQFATWTFARQGPLDGEALRAAIAALPAAVVRAKGIVSLAGQPGRRFVFQLVGRRWSLEPEDAAPSDDLPGGSVVVCIGPAGQFQQEHLESLFAGTLASATPPGLADLLQDGRRA